MRLTRIVRAVPTQNRGVGGQTDGQHVKDPTNGQGDQQMASVTSTYSNKGQDQTDRQMAMEDGKL